MTARNPIYWDGTTLRHMSQAQIDDVIDLAIYNYGLNPSSHVGYYINSTGNLNPMEDTRLQAGTYLTSTGNQDADDDGAAEYPQESETPEPTVVTVVWDGLFDSQDTVDQLYLTPSTIYSSTGSFPYYESDGDIIAMTHEDTLDTFIRPAINKMVDGGLSSEEQAGIYFVYTAINADSGSFDATHILSKDTGLSSQIFVDTRADTTAYTAAGIPEDIDQPQTIDRWFLQRVEPSSRPSTVSMLRQLGDSSDVDLRAIKSTELDNMLGQMIRWAAVNDPGYRIKYQIDSADGPGQSPGVGMTDTRLNGDGNYQTRFVSANDYRAQEFPNGTAVGQNTYYLKVFTE
jgi:hypothetical protein